MKLPEELRKYAAYAAWYLPAFILRPFLRLTFRLRTTGLENIPIKGGALFVCNHGTYLDPAILGAFLPRKFHFIAKSDLFKYPALKQFCEAEQCLMVHRGEPDRKVLLEAVARLQANQAVLIFPEGTRVLSGVGPAEPGVGLIALRAQVPVIPMALRGHHKAWPQRTPIPRFFQAQIELRVGKPVNLSDLFDARPRGAAARAATDRLIRAVERLYKEGSVPD